jgi:hypothetical protein
MVTCIKHKSELTHDVCEDCLMHASEQMLSNMGTPDYFVCGHCGERFSPEAFSEHAKVI